MSQKNKASKRNKGKKPKTASLLEMLILPCIVAVAGGGILYYLSKSHPITTDRVEVVFRVALGLLAASLGTLIPGLLRVDIEHGLGKIRAAGAAAFFLIVYFFNPVSMVSVPAKTLSPAKSSATAYYYNYISPVLDAVSFGRTVQDSSTQEPIDKDVIMIILIPDELVDASHAGAKTLLESRFDRVYIQTVNRNFSMFAYQPSSRPNEVAIIDVPTGLSTLRQIIDLRLGLGSLGSESSQIAKLEEEDKERFKSTLLLLISREHLSRYRVRIMTENELDDYITQTTS